jgi:sugar phosphate isomerase/epimerase
MTTRNSQGTRSARSESAGGFDMPRREFISLSAAAACGWTVGSSGLVLRKERVLVEPSMRAIQDRVAFNTANLVGRVTGYRFELSNWGEQHRKTVAATDETAWRQICAEIAAAGFTAVEIWEAHASPDALDEAKARTWKVILGDHGLEPIAYAGSLRRETLQMCQWMGIPHIDGGLGDLSPEQATRLCEETGIPFNVENHPEKNAAEILSQIDGGNRWLGVCVDTGWLATQSAPVPETILAIGELVRHTHIKDVKRHGAHETCLLGEGVAQVDVCLEALEIIGYQGWYSWEDEPEDRNPFESAVRNRRWIEERIA